MDDLTFHFLGPAFPDPEITRHADKLLALDRVRARLRRNFNVKGADATGRQIAAARRKLINTLERT